MAHNQIEHHRKHFTSHWPIDSVNIALQKGDVFKSMFRVNAHNRVEAYCKVDGLPVDVLIYGFQSQNRAVFLSEARVLSLGPKFMSIYVTKLAIERRIDYDEVEGLTAEWLDVTSTLILNFIPNNRSHKKGSNSRFRTVEEVAMVTFPYNMASEPGLSKNADIEPAVFPLVLNILSTVPVAVHPIAGDDGPINIGARLYMSSYFC